MQHIKIQQPMHTKQNLKNTKKSLRSIEKTVCPPAFFSWFFNKKIEEPRPLSVYLAPQPERPMLTTITYDLRHLLQMPECGNTNSRMWFH